MSMKETLAQLHTKVAEELLEKIESGAATAADLSVARQFLRDNGIDSLALEGSPIQSLSEIVPFADPEEPIAQTGG